VGGSRGSLRAGSFLAPRCLFQPLMGLSECWCGRTLVFLGDDVAERWLFWVLMWPSAGRFVSVLVRQSAGLVGRFGGICQSAGLVFWWRMGSFVGRPSSRAPCPLAPTIAVRRAGAGLPRCHLRCCLRQLPSDSLGRIDGASGHGTHADVLRVSRHAALLDLGRGRGLRGPPMPAARAAVIGIRVVRRRGGDRLRVHARRLTAARAAFVGIRVVRPRCDVRSRVHARRLTAARAAFVGIRAVGRRYGDRSRVHARRLTAARAAFVGIRALRCRCGDRLREHARRLTAARAAFVGIRAVRRRCCDRSRVDARRLWPPGRP